MQPRLIECMRAQVRTIYRALTGQDVPEVEMARLPSETPPEEELTRSFAELETLVRMAPELAQKVPPFSFTPAVDVIGGDNECLIEVAVPGVERSDLTIECSDSTLVVSGIRRARPNSSGGSYSHTEIPCGPFYRDVRLPFPVREDPAVELDEGLLRVRVRKSATENAQGAAEGAR